MSDTTVGEDPSDMVCPSCDAENIEQIQSTQPVYRCRACGAEFHPDGELVDEE
ncbi:hypothetical protein [Halococcus sediminicola]|uniref:hypothetical protein n=1 Tax=Halococcus sediminicola TaxID=1264579 RepID=UPI0012ABB57B|nr:hypothetical protein [Halococcus sediminicola]